MVYFVCYNRSMNIILTGKPGIGKSTVIGTYIKSFGSTSLWMLTTEVLGESGQRVGFKSTTSTGHKRLVSHKSDIHSDVMIGSNNVDTVALNEILSIIKDEVDNTNPDMIILDEIGPIQLSDTTFIDVFDKIFESNINLLASVHINDERLSKYRQSPSAINISVSETNRNELPEIIEYIFSHHNGFNSLDNDRKIIINGLAEHYVETNQTVQLNKLYTNAIPYFIDNQITQLDSAHWNVLGKHGSYTVTDNDDQYSCICNLYLGKNEYLHSSGDCSHIQAVMLFRNMAKSSKLVH
ncbi:MAG: hypothetical protein JWO54_822 [Candidatus Saccharibacteria bacterium]|nr:hypothetical protein [Candidatus Saccharibacteria bacterium]